MLTLASAERRQGQWRQRREIPGPPHAARVWRRLGQRPVRCQSRSSPSRRLHMTGLWPPHSRPRWRRGRYWGRELLW